MYTFDNKSLLKDGIRCFPVMGEIHYSRYPKEFWKESLCKMKAGGVTIASAYVIWIHHEEIEDKYDFSGDRDLHAFVQACKDCKMKLMLRIGPWIHGEVRNGGFPDWLLKKDFQVRTNDEKYFAAVEKWYKRIYQEVADFFASPDNPIVGVQIENEFGHCGGLYDESGEDHMKRLYKLAREIGFKVDLYTATGWGGARTGGLLPVMGGYCDAPWDQRTVEIEPSGNYIFTLERNDHNIGSDYGFGHGVMFDVNKFPYLTAELGGGLQVTQHRRTVAKAQDIGAMTLVKLGSGVNLLGYYMYHGGTNPEGKLTSLQESRATGYPNDLPEKSYDFRAPIREFGQVSDSLRELKLYSYFVADFGSELCELPAIIPEDNPLKPDNLSELRYSYRSDGKKGYLFVNNYVRLKKMPDFPNRTLKTPEGTSFPTVDIKSGDYFFWPFNMEYGNCKVKTAEASPFCRLADGTFVFYTNQDNKNKDYFQFENNDKDEEKALPKFLLLSREDALNAWKTKDICLVITKGVFYTRQNGSQTLTLRSNEKFYAYPALKKVPEGIKTSSLVNKNIARDLPSFNFTTYEFKASAGKIKDAVGYKLIKDFKDNEGLSLYQLDVSSLMKRFAEEKQNNAIDCFLKISYCGESARLYSVKDGKRTLLLDNFYLGSGYDWEIGLKRFLNTDIDFSKLELEIRVLKPDAKIYFENKNDLPKESTAQLQSTSAEFEYQIVFE